MRKILASFGLAIALALVSAPAAFARDVYDDRVIFGGTFTLADSETIDGDLVVFGGDVTVESGGAITGDVVIFGGAVDIGGHVNGDVVIFGGGGSILGTAEIDGDLVTIGGGITKEPGAIVHGGEAFGFSGDEPGTPNVEQPRLPARARVGSMLEDALNALLWSVGLGLMALLAFLFIPDHLNRVGQATTDSPLAAGGLGLVTLVLAPFVALLLTITIILIPLTVLGLIVLTVALLLGWLAIGAMVGQRMLASSVVHGTSPAIAAGIGVFVLTLVFRTLQLAPNVGFVFTIFGGLLLSAGLGAVVLTRFGVRAYGPSLPATRTPAPHSEFSDTPDSLGADADAVK